MVKVMDLGSFEVLITAVVNQVPIDNQQVRFSLKQDRSENTHINVT